MRRLIVQCSMVGVCTLVVLACAARWAHRQTKKVPEFYEQAIVAVPQRQLAQSSQRLEADVKRLEKEVEEKAVWSAEFESDQINAWLSEEFPKRMPRLNAKGLSDPRVLIEQDTLTDAAKYKDSRLDTILSCRLRVRLTDQPNRLAISVDGIWAGALPLPLSQFQERIERLMSRTDMNFEWDASDEQTVALVTLPSASKGAKGEDTVIESLRFEPDRISVAGQTGKTSEMAFAPRGPVYRLASLARPFAAQVLPPTLSIQDDETTPESDGERSSFTPLRNDF